MYCNYYKSDDGAFRDWFSLSLDKDELGIEILTTVKNTVKKELTEAINLDQFERSHKLVNILNDIENALLEAGTNAD